VFRQRRVDLSAANLRPREVQLVEGCDLLAHGRLADARFTSHGRERAAFDDAHEGPYSVEIMVHGDILSRNEMYTTARPT
jgi:hypothetical protein